MNRRIKKNGKRIKKFEFARRVNKKILEKKPQNGGTPAIEKSEMIKTLEKKLRAPKSIKDWRVLYSEWRNWKKVKNTT